eukprot:1810548-Prymnesium_polylepis.1
MTRSGTLPFLVCVLKCAQRVIVWCVHNNRQGESVSCVKHPIHADLDILLKWRDSPWLRESWNYPGLLPRGVGFLALHTPVNPTFRPGFPSPLCGSA